MQHVFVNSPAISEEDYASQSGSFDGELSEETPLEMLYTDTDDEILTDLPFDGYRILEGVVSATYEYFPVYSLLSPPRSALLSQIRQSLVRGGRYVGRNWSSILLIFVPLGIIAPRVDVSDLWVFVLNSLAIIALADVLCRATDDVASYLGETIGALLNITMGNVTELVIFHALIQRQYMIVRTSLLGSIIINILLVLGLAIFAGEYQQHGQTYNVFATRVAAGLLCLTKTSLLIPASLKTSSDATQLTQVNLNLSRATSVVLIVVYFVYLSTQIRSPQFAYKSLINLDLETPSDIPEMDEGLPSPSIHSRGRASPLLCERADNTESHIRIIIVGNGEHRLASSYISPPSLVADFTLFDGVTPDSWVRKAIPVIMLTFSTGMISVCGSFLVDSIDHFASHINISKTMVGLIILPLVGNAAELVSGVMFASKSRMDLAFAVSIGSALQIALFVVPLMVLIGWGMGGEFGFQFTRREAVVLIGSVVVFAGLGWEGRCSVIKGTGLCAGYVVIMLTSYFIPTTE